MGSRYTRKSMDMAICCCPDASIYCASAISKVSLSVLFGNQSVLPGSLIPAFCKLSGTNTRKYVSFLILFVKNVLDEKKIQGVSEKSVFLRNLYLITSKCVHK